ncbi:MAG: hypothetical protein R2932_00880 [Caldilineaceae bacterium]
MYTEFEHSGDVRAAVKAAARALGIAHEPHSYHVVTTLVDELATVDDADLKIFALDNVATLAELPIAELSKFSEALQGRGIPSEWVRRN